MSSTSSSPGAKIALDRSRRTAMRALLVLVGVTVVLAALTGVYLVTRPSYAGQWVGPGNVQQGSGDPIAVIVSLTLEQSPLGGISGTGTACAAVNGTLDQVPLGVDGNLAGSAASLTLHVGGHDTTIVPAALTIQASLSQGQLTLTADAPAHLLLTLQHGSASDFSAACSQLAQSAPGG